MCVSVEVNVWLGIYRGGWGSQMTRIGKQEWVVRMYSYRCSQFILEVWL